MSTPKPLQVTDPRIQSFMHLASQALQNPLLPQPKEIFAFGGSDTRLSEELLSLALSGAKTATTSWPIPDPLPWGVGDYSVILDGRGEPAALMQTLELVRCRFKHVPVRLALREAEGDYDDYRRGHFDFYRRNAPEEGGEQFDDESWVLMEGFRVVYPVPESST